MSCIRSVDTKPEIVVRSLLHRMGFRFRLYVKGLPGRPDIVLPKHKTVIFVNGCFWHRHGCGRFRMPKSNVDYWEDKFDKNVARDKRNISSLKALGWKVIVVWECEITDMKRLMDRLDRELMGNLL